MQNQQELLRQQAWNNWQTNYRQLASQYGTFDNYFAAFAQSQNQSQSQQPIQQWNWNNQPQNQNWNGQANNGLPPLPYESQPQNQNQNFWMQGNQNQPQQQQPIQPLTDWQQTQGQQPPQQPNWQHGQPVQQPNQPPKVGNRPPKIGFNVPANHIPVQVGSNGNSDGNGAVLPPALLSQLQGGTPVYEADYETEEEGAEETPVATKQSKERSWYAIFWMIICALVVFIATLNVASQFLNPVFTLIAAIVLPFAPALAIEAGHRAFVWIIAPGRVLRDAFLGTLTISFIGGLYMLAIGAPMVYSWQIADVVWGRSLPMLGGAFLFGVLMNITQTAYCISKKLR